MITIYEQVGGDLSELAARLAASFGFPVLAKDFQRRLEEEHNVYARYTPVMKFVLSDKEERLFRAHRMCYLGSIDDWIDIAYSKPIEELARELIPTLGTDEFFQLY